ncbi:hypothetical protein L9F63_006956, partial [Diploptera punctata]
PKASYFSHLRRIESRPIVASLVDHMRRLEAKECKNITSSPSTDCGRLASQVFVSISGNTPIARRTRQALTEENSTIQKPRR